MSNATATRLPAASASEVEFVRSLANPSEVLNAIERGHAAVANAASPMELAAAVAGTWLEIAELEGDEAAETITQNVWPLDSDPQVLAAAA